MNRIAKKTRETGAALLTVLIAMMIISIMLFEFQYASMVERKLAYNELNQLQAYYLAKAGARIGLLRLSLYGRARKSPNFADLLKNGIGPYFEMIWNLPLPPFPPETPTTAMAKEDKDNATTVLEQTKITDGKFTHVITSEGSKINLNFLTVPANKLNERLDFRAQPTSVAEYVAKMLYQLLDNFLKDSEDPRAEYGDMRPEEVVADIMDWVNPGNARFAGGPKDTWYEQQNPPYKAKKNKFYTVDELRLVRGIDEHLFNKLKPYVTVYSEDGKINLNTATDTMLRAIYYDFTEDDLKRINEERTVRGGWATEKDFVDYVTTNLNRTAFKTYYDRPENYPFTVGGRAFLLESLGTIQRSGSEIQKIIRVGVALTNPKGGQALPQFKTEQECTNAKKLWFREGFACYEVPTEQAECTKVPGAVWEEPQPGKFCCRPIKNPPCTPAAGTGTGTGTGTPATPVQAEAESMKILFWSES